MIPNLRDVGEVVNILSGEELMREKILYRGGAVNQLFDASELPAIRTIVNLRAGKDQEFKNIRNIHLPAEDSIGNYSTNKPKVKRWMNSVVQAISCSDIYPLLIHCSVGRDRTGVIVALILACLDIAKEVIVEDYLLSEGVDGPQRIEAALNGFGAVEDFIQDRSIIGFFRSRLLVN